MKDFLLTSTLPYWIVFTLMAAAGFIAIVNMRKKSISRLSVQLVTFLAIVGTVFGLVIYSLLGGKSIWWCTSSDYGFFGKLLRVIPLIVFVGIQLTQVFVYKAFVEQYFQKELSIKGTFVSLIVIVPATLVLYVILNMFGLEKETRDIVAYSILGLALVVGVGWAMVRNVKSIGMMYGLMFTVATLVKLLVEKGFVSYQAFGNTYRYEAKITRKEYKGSAIGEIVSQYFDNSYTKVVSQFIEDEKMDLEELKQLIAQIEQGKTDHKS